MMQKFFGLRANIYSYIIDDCSKDKKSNDTKKCVVKRKHKFEDYKHRLEEIQLESK